MIQFIPILEIEKKELESILSDSQLDKEEIISYTKQKQVILKLIERIKQEDDMLDAHDEIIEICKLQLT